MPILKITYHYFPDCLVTQDTCHRFQRKLTKQQYKQCLAVADKNHKQVCSLTFLKKHEFKIPSFFHTLFIRMTPTSSSASTTPSNTAEKEEEENPLTFKDFFVSDIFRFLSHEGEIKRGEKIKKYHQ